MRNTINIFFLIFIFKIGNSQELQIPPNRIQDIEIDDNLQNSSIRDSIMSKFGNRSTKLNKNPDAKIQDYLIITRYHDTIIVDTSLTIEKYHKSLMNLKSYLRLLSSNSISKNLKKGYSILMNHNKIIKSIKNIKPNSNLKAKLADGELQVNVKNQAILGKLIKKLQLIKGIDKINRK